MYPASTKQGAAVSSFPDVCKVPSPGGPLPIPYPNAQLATPSPIQIQLKASSGLLTTKLTPAHLTPVQLKTKLATLHGQLVGLPGGNPNQWHALVDDYVITAAALYITLSEH